MSSLKEESKRVRSDEPARDEGFEHDLAQKRSKSFVQDGVDEAEIMVPTATAEVAVQPANPVVEVKLRSVTDDALLNVSLAKTSFWRD